MKLPKRLKRFMRRQRSRKLTLGLLVILSVVTFIGYSQYMQSKRQMIDPASYKPLLDTVARAESGGNYNAYYGNATNSTLKFTDMSINDVLKWQADYIAQGSASSAVGRYQILNTTLAGLVKQMGLTGEERFDEATQDRMAIALLERRGAEAYANQELDQTGFAANIAKEWAGLPKATGSNPEQSYYASDGLNKSRVSVQEVLSAVDSITTEK